MSSSWVCLGVTCSAAPARRPPAPQHRLSAGPQSCSWCLGGTRSSKFSVWHNNTQTVLHGGYRTLDVMLDCAAGCLSFYMTAGGVSLLYRFLLPSWSRSTPLSWLAAAPSVTLKQRPSEA